MLPTAARRRSIGSQTWTSDTTTLTTTHASRMRRPRQPPAPIAVAKQRWAFRDGLSVQGGWAFGSSIKAYVVGRDGRRVPVTIILCAEQGGECLNASGPRRAPRSGGRCRCAVRCRAGCSPSGAKPPRTRAVRPGKLRPPPSRTGRAPPNRTPDRAGAARRPTAPPAPSARRGPVGGRAPVAGARAGRSRPRGARTAYDPPGTCTNPYPASGAAVQARPGRRLYTLQAVKYGSALFLLYTDRARRTRRFKSDRDRA